MAEANCLNPSTALPSAAASATFRPSSDQPSPASGQNSIKQDRSSESNGVIEPHGALAFYSFADSLDWPERCNAQHGLGAGIRTVWR